MADIASGWFGVAKHGYAWVSGIGVIPHIRLIPLVERVGVLEALNVEYKDLYNKLGLQFVEGRPFAPHVQRRVVRAFRHTLWYALDRSVLDRSVVLSAWRTRDA